MLAIFLHPLFRRAGILALLLMVCTLGGCQMWNAEQWNLDRYRDTRAVDIEEGLSREKPIVESPF